MLTHIFYRLTSFSHRLSLLMLGTLHTALLVEMQSLWMRPMVLMHLGLFLLWQPLWRGESKLRLSSASLIIAMSLIAMFLLNWWLLAFWVSVLFALVGGRVFAFHAPRQRLYYLLMMSYLLAILVLDIVPHLFALSDVGDTTGILMSLGLPFLLLVMAFIPVERDKAKVQQAVDFIYILLLFTLLTLLILGSLAFMTLGQVTYLEALLDTLFIIALALFILGGLWNPHMGFSGLQTGFSRYVLSIGTPLEIWLERLAGVAQHEQSPEIFLARATEYLIEMPWISGLSWVSNRGHGTLGESSQHRVELSDEDLNLVLFTRQAISPTMLLHMRLLVQVLGHFYQAKRHEQRLNEITRQQAIYETGSRLTHDLKNMLQSLFALTSVAQHQPEKAQPVLQRQLPVLTQRIELLLTKLKNPQKEMDESGEQPLENWWQALRQRHQHRDIEWRLIDESTGEDNVVGRVGASAPYGHGLPLADEPAMRNQGVVGRASARHVGLKPDLRSNGQSGTKTIPVALFDSVADNLIDNATNKQLREPGIAVTVTLHVEPFSLEVRDTGSAIPDGIARQLMNNIVPSEDGLGIGLYQIARRAAQSGYRLELGENGEGRVTFRLVGAEQ
jgi:nitrogen-specific signal transduction histidine kinase